MTCCCFPFRLCSGCPVVVVSAVTAVGLVSVVELFESLFVVVCGSEAHCSIRTCRYELDLTCDWFGLVVCTDGGA